MMYIQELHRRTKTSKIQMQQIAINTKVKFQPEMEIKFQTHTRLKPAIHCGEFHKHTGQRSTI